MSELIAESTPVSRKDRNCMACEWLVNSDFPVRELTFSERRQVVMAKRNGWRIKAGERYLKAVVKCCGDFGVFQAIPAIDEICRNHDIYEDVC